MEHHFLRLLAAGMLVGAMGPVSAAEWRMVWSDEFVAPGIDGAKWTHEVNGAGGGNSELQYYTARPQNSFIQDGKLVIRAIKEVYTGPDGTRDYTSARLNTKNKGDWTYGRMEIRAKVPGGQGLWPAIWMLPTDNTYGGWAASGEIDIMEHKGDEPENLYTTIHYGGTWPANTNNGSTFAGPDLTLDFHEYAVEWAPTQFRWYFDGNLVYTTSTWYSTSAAYPAPFNERFHMLLNVAVGGNFLPNPPANPNYFPKEMQVDSVRVYEAVASPPAQTPLGGTPISIPGKVPCASFDNGGQDVAYHDTTPANIPNVSRTSEGVDLEASGDIDGGYSLGYFEAGEWLEYTADVQHTDNYNVVARVASLSTGGTLTVRATDASGNVMTAHASFAATGGWNTWADAAIGTLPLTTGLHTIRITSEAPGFNLNYLMITPPPQASYGPSAISIPGKVPASDFDDGGEGVAYHDTTTSNIGGSYRPAEGVDLGPSGDIDGGYSIGWFEIGEWVEHTINVQQTAVYDVEARVASQPSTGALKLTFTDGGYNETTLSGITPQTGGWTTWASAPLGAVSLAAGPYILRTELTAGAANFNYLFFTQQAPAGTDAWILLAE